MEALSQLDVQNPDHVSVITRDGKVTVSVVKDGTSVTLGFPIKNSVFDTTPRPPLQQPAPKLMAVKSQESIAAGSKPTLGKVRQSPMGNRKLTPDEVREIKLMLSNAKTMSSFGSKHNAYVIMAKSYNVSHHTISNIHKGIAWKQVKV